MKGVYQLRPERHPVEAGADEGYKCWVAPNKRYFSWMSADADDPGGAGAGVEFRREDYGDEVNPTTGVPKKVSAKNASDKDKKGEKEFSAVTPGEPGSGDTKSGGAQAVDH